MRISCKDARVSLLHKIPKVNSHHDLATYAVILYWEWISTLVQLIFLCESDHYSENFGKKDQSPVNFCEGKKNCMLGIYL